MLRRTCWCIILAAIVVTPISIKAQGELFLGPHLGIQKSSDADNANYLVGTSLRLRLMPVLGLEGAISYRQEDYANDALTVRDWPVTVTGLLYPLPVVYGGLGAGWYNTTFDYDATVNNTGIADNTDQKFGWHLAAGLQVPASRSVHLVGDVRYVFIDYNLDELPGTVVNGDNPDFYSISLGLLFRL